MESQAAGCIIREFADQRPAKRFKGKGGAIHYVPQNVEPKPQHCKREGPFPVEGPKAKRCRFAKTHAAATSAMAEHATAEAAAVQAEIEADEEAAQAKTEAEDTSEDKSEPESELIERLVTAGINGNMDEINTLENKVLRGKIKAAIVKAKRASS